jgi:glycerol kinase
LAVGFWSGRDDLIRSRADDTIFKPSRPQAEMARLREGWNRALDRAKSWERPI